MRLFAPLVVDYFAYAARSLSTSSPTSCVRVNRHLAWLVAWLVALLVVDYLAYVARPGASARHAARR
jgi:hypothetical protein